MLKFSLIDIVGAALILASIVIAMYIFFSCEQIGLRSIVAGAIVLINGVTAGIFLFLLSIFFNSLPDK